MNVSDCICVKDFEQLAAKKLSQSTFDYFTGGATDEETLRENCTAFKSWRFQPRVLRDVSYIDTRSSVLGDEISFPTCIAPTAMNKLASPQGEIGSAKAAANLKTGFMLSSWANTSIEEISLCVPTVLRWLQLHLYSDCSLIGTLVRKAERNGFRAIVVTIDTPIAGKKYRDVRNQFGIPHGMMFKNFDQSQNIDNRFAKRVKSALDSQSLSEYVSTLIDPSMTWDDFDWLKTITNLPIIVKGILSAETAIEAVTHNVDGIIVSNHGARQFDGIHATINALPQVVEAVKGRCEVYLDGGIRNGGDVAKAIALGAKTVFVGRPVLWGLACNGEHGVHKVLEILRDEFQLTMKLLGVRSIKELQSIPNLVVHESKILAKL